MRARRTGWEGSVEVEIELGIKDQIILRDFGPMDLVVTFGVDLAEAVFKSCTRIKRVTFHNATTRSFLRWMDGPLCAYSFSFLLIA
jgi:hypothetical protein